MAVKLKAKFSLFRCGRCQRGYSSPLGHMCVIRMDRKAPVRPGRVAPKVSVHGMCGKCGRRLGNPLTHVCVIRSDWKQRKAAAARAAKKAARAKAPQHPYQSCRDDDCKRLTCGAYREGRAEGFAEGLEAGHREAQ